jgi:hypothetical protein
MELLLVSSERDGGYHYSVGSSSQPEAVFSRFTELESQQLFDSDTAVPVICVRSKVC